MTKLDFAFWDAVPESPAEGQTMADIYDDHIRLAQHIEELGWHSYFTIEHQNRPADAGILGKGLEFARRVGRDVPDCGDPDAAVRSAGLGRPLAPPLETHGRAATVVSGCRGS